jgi:hypothetical protein
MESRIQKQIRHARKNVAKPSVLWRGARGTCPCCENRLDLWAASALHPLPETPWVIPEELLAGVYQELSKRLVDKSVNGKWTLYTRCAVALVNDHKAIQSKMYFVAINGLAGPFCLPHLKDFLRRWEKPEGETEDLEIYIVSTSHESLKKLLNAKINKNTTLVSDSPIGRDLY